MSHNEIEKDAGCFRKRAKASSEGSAGLRRVVGKVRAVPVSAASVVLLIITAGRHIVGIVPVVGRSR